MIAYPLRILLVEVDPHQAFAIESALQKHIDQIEIVTSSNGEECIRRLSEAEYSAVMLDYDLPGLNGVELIERIRNQGWQFPVIMVTGEGDEEIAVRAMKAGANEYVSKSKGYLSKLPRILESSIEKSNLEIELKQAEERYKKLAENASDLIFTMDTSLNIRFVTSRICQFLGYSPEEAIGKNLAEFLSPESPADLLQEILRPGRLSGGTQLIEMEWSTKDGELRNVELSIGRIISRHKVVAYQGIARDCTQRVALEKQIRRRNRELTAVVSVTSVISHTLDFEEISRASLSQLCELAELTCGAFVIATFDETISRVVSHHNFSARFISQLAEKSLLQGLFKGLAGFKRPWTNREHDEFPPSPTFDKVAALCADEGVRSHLILPLLFNDELLGFLLGGRHLKKDFKPEDIEILAAVGKQISMALVNARLFHAVRDAKKEWETTFDTMSELVYMQDPEGKIMRVNKTLARRLNYQPQDMVNRKAEEVFQAPQSAWCHHQKEEMYAQGNVISVEFEDPLLKGFFEISTTPVYTADGRLFAWLFVGKDVTEQRKLQNQIVELERRTALGEMASGVAHDFNNLLAQILGKTQLLLRQLEQGRLSNFETLKSDLKIIEEKSIQGAQTVKRIQDFTRVRVDQQFQEVSLDEVIRAAIDAVQPVCDKLKTEGVRIEILFKRREIPPVSGNRSELVEVVRNILRNSIDAMPEGGVIRISTLVEQGDHQSNALIQIVDTGVGMSEEVKRKIFDPFFSTKGPKGTGLGMSVAFGIIRRHQGDIKFLSELGRGTTCIITLPISSKPTVHVEQETKVVEKKRIRILVIDDEPVIRDFMAEMFHSNGYSVDVAADGPEAIALFESSHYDVIFSDLGLPGMTGWDIAKKIRASDLKVPIILLSGWSIQLDDARVKESGITQVLPKPCQMQDLLNAVQSVLNHPFTNGN